MTLAPATLTDTLARQGAGVDLGLLALIAAAEVNIGSQTITLQKMLREIGLNPGSIDGIAGPKTLEALKLAELTHSPAFIRAAYFRSACEPTFSLPRYHRCVDVISRALLPTLLNVKLEPELRLKVLTTQNILDLTISDEGGYSNDPFDRGGETNFGVTQRTLDAYRITKPGAEEFPVSVRDLTRANAQAIYRDRYMLQWIERLPSGIAYLVFDSSIMSGDSRAFSLLTQAVQTEYLERGETAPSFGRDEAAGMIVYCDIARLAHLLTAARVRFLLNLGADPTQERFARGWFNRAASGLVHVLG